MRRGLNKVILTGNLTKDPDIRHTPSKQKVARFTVAVGRQWKNRSTGETQNHTDFIPVVAWGFLADICDRYLRKGKPVLVEGRIQVRDYDDPKTGMRRLATEVIAENMTMLPGGRRDEEQGQCQLRESNYGRQNENLPGRYGQDAEFEEDFPLDFADLGGEDFGGGRGEVDVPF